MSFSNTLAHLIKHSNLTLKSISSRCKEEGLSITDSYISQLKSGKLNSPSVEICEVLAKVLNVDSNILILESYLDKSPNKLIEFLNRIRFYYLGKDYILSTLLNSPKEKVDLEIEMYMMALNKEPLSEFILSVNTENLVTSAISRCIISSHFDHLYDTEDFSNKSNQNPAMNYEDILEITNIKIFRYESARWDIVDDSMAPMLNIGDIAIFENIEYKRGDIVHYWDKTKNEFIIRKYNFKDDMVLMIPANDLYEIFIYKQEEIEIYGKLVTIVKQL